MKITDLLKKDTVIIDLAATNKAAAIDEMTKKLDEAGRLNNLDGFIEAILDRESQSTTGIGEGIAIPHAKTDAVKTPSILFAKSTKGVDYERIRTRGNGFPSGSPAFPAGMRRICLQYSPRRRRMRPACGMR